MKNMNHQKITSSLLDLDHITLNFFEQFYYNKYINRHHTNT